DSRAPAALRDRGRELRRPLRRGARPHDPALLSRRVHLLGHRALARPERPTADPRLLRALPGDARAAARSALLADERPRPRLSPDPGRERAGDVPGSGAGLPAGAPARWRRLDVPGGCWPDRRL